ncbi:MAG: aldehyde dehydrogenase [Clostridia bacterium]|nr:aldehyde dehydrogenase [Clostridia bacterium]
MSNITEIVNSQQEYYLSGATIPLSFRKMMLKKLYNAVKEKEKAICQALYADLGKSNYESFMCEAGLALTEISYMLKNLKKLAKPKRVATPLAQFPSKSYTVAVPYGNVLIMSPWNYPFLLAIEPLANAIAAGNTAVVKPSAYAPNTARVVKDIIDTCFPAQYVACITGGRAENAQLLSQKFDMIFFTGSKSVGKEVLRRAAENLTPAVLELGGKSPCIVDETAKIPLAAKRIVFGKYLNCGQTCVAPDYILCHQSVKEQLIAELKKQITLQFGEKPLNNPNYGRIINDKHFNRLLGLIDNNKVVAGGGYNQTTLQIEPTVMDNVTYDDTVMGEEIFGPVLPIITYTDFQSVIKTLKRLEKPLALYLFTNDKSHIKAVEALSYGGGCINDVVIHLATSNMPFGGVGESGMGGYHGKAGFNAFSHTKSIVNKKTWLDLPMRYQPYKSGLYTKLLRMFLK